MAGWFGRKKQTPTPGTAQLNMKLQPIHRGEFEDAWETMVERAGLPPIVGGGTMMSAGGEVDFCDLEFEFADASAAAVRRTIEALEALGAAKGSVLRLHTEPGQEFPFGVNEGLGLYLNGTDLPEEVYASTNADELADRLAQALGDAGSLHSWWDGPTETALYLYGPSFARMSELIAPVVADYPLCQRARVVQIA